MAMPPTMSKISDIEKGARERHASIRGRKMPAVQKSRELIRHIEFLQDIHNIHGPHMKNTYDALDIAFRPDEVEVEKGVKYLPVDIVLYRFLSALEKDKEIIHKAWVDLRDKVEREILAFAPK